MHRHTMVTVALVLIALFAVADSIGAWTDHYPTLSSLLRVWSTECRWVKPGVVAVGIGFVAWLYWHLFC